MCWGVTAENKLGCRCLECSGNTALLLMLQVWILKGRRAEDEMYRSMWERAMDDMIARLVVRNNMSGLTYLATLTPCATPAAVSCSLKPNP